MESIVRPVPSWDEFGEGRMREVFRAFRSPAGEEMVLQKNLFVDNVLPGGVLRDLTEEEMAEYRRPFATPGEDRRPTLTWPRQIPIEGEPADVAGRVEAYSQWLATSPVPKLWFDVEPGAIVSGPARDFVRTWPNLTERRLNGSHFVQEDDPDTIGKETAAWLASL